MTGSRSRKGLAMKRNPDAEGLDMDNWMTLAQASQRFRKNGINVSPTAIWRWCTRGVGVAGLKLEHGRIGQRYVVTADAIDTFIKRLGERPEAPPKRQHRRRKTVDPNSILKTQQRLAQRGL